MVSGADSGSTPCADRLDDSGAFVAEDRRTRRLRGSVDGVPVGVADAAGAEPDEHLFRSRSCELELADRQWATRRFEHRRADLHQRRPGAKGSSSGAMRPSSTSGASSAAVAGASVTPSIPCPEATNSPGCPGSAPISGRPSAVAGRSPAQVATGPSASGRHPERYGRAAASRRSPAPGGASARGRSELEDAGETHAVRVGAHADLRLGEIERMTGRCAISGNRDAIASSGLNRDVHAEATEELDGREPCGHHHLRRRAGLPCWS